MEDLAAQRQTKAQAFLAANSATVPNDLKSTAFRRFLDLKPSIVLRQLARRTNASRGDRNAADFQLEYRATPYMNFSHKTTVERYPR